MDGRHVEFSLEDLKVEQENIDRLIDALLSSNPSSLSGSLQQQRRGSEVSNPATPVGGRGSRGTGPGRPRGVRTSARTQSSSTPEISENSSLSVVIQCLNKLNLQNKRLLDYVEVVSDKVEGASISNTGTGTVEDSGEVGGVSATSKSLESVNDRLEKIEQNININTLICRGSAVENLIKDSLTGDSHNLERLKGEICRTACGEEVTGIDISNVQVSVIGRNKKCIKVNCPNSVSKLHLLKKTRSRKPEGFYMNEFLTTNKLKIFHNLRSLKKQHPQRIKTVFTRGGNILYTLYNTDRVFQASSLSDLENILKSNVNEGAAEIA